MKNLSDFLKESINESETIKSEKDFRAAAKAKFEEVYGDDLDEKKMKKTIDGLLEDNKDLVEKGEWGELIGMLNQSFAPKGGNTNEGLLDAKVLGDMEKATTKDIDALPADRRNARFFADVANTFDALGTPISTVSISGNTSKVTRNNVPAYDALKSMMKTRDYDSYVDKYPEAAEALLHRLFPSKANGMLDNATMVDLFRELFG